MDKPTNTLSKQKKWRHVGGDDHIDSQELLNVFRWDYLVPLLGFCANVFALLVSFVILGLSEVGKVG